MKKPLFSVLILGGILLFTSCGNRPTGEVVTNDHNPKEDKYAPYVEGNKKILHWENEEMEMFIKRYQWDMQRTGTGLYIEILDPGKGECLKEGDMVTLDYQTFLLDGQRIYCSDSDGLKQFTVDRSEEIDGLHEAAKMLRHGAKARLVIPSYLAYGVAGDGNRVVGRQALAMTITVL
jgi:FKBP-type peptidyl-prolyl cis-trans isomerase